MKVLLISGSQPPSPCGVGDYSHQLYLSLFDKDYSVKLFKPQVWNFANLINIVNAIKKESPTFIHIQYPTVAYGYSLVPQLLSILFPSVVTIHEFSQAHILRKLSLVFFTLRSTLIFTTSYEQDCFCKFYFWINKKDTKSFPLGSNIKPKRNIQQKRIADPLLISYFGLIRPDKGLEDFIKLLDISKKNEKAIKGRIIGRIPQSDVHYASQLQSVTANLPIEWYLDQPEDTVSDLLFETTFTYLPFPDGASLRRGSLLAALSHATRVITTRGLQTPMCLDTVVFYADSPQDAFVILTEFDHSASKEDVLVQKTNLFLLSFHWETIAENHINLYDLIVAKRNHTLLSHA
jgi:glycosyltransferase involved in cell wall biosynthesis